MNKQQKTYGLLLAVLMIWGIIGYQIYLRLNPAVPKLEVVELKNSFVPQQNVKNPFYKVKPNYRDPFLRKFSKRKKVVKRQIVKPKSTAPFPNVIYNGVIEGNKSKSYILTINGHQEIVKLGQTALGVRLVKANTKQAIIRFQGVKKTIQLQ